MRRQIKPMRSSKMREPARGALGRMSEAGVSAISWRQATIVAPTTPTANSATDTIDDTMSYESSIWGSEYMSSNTVNKNSGRPTKPMILPSTPPIRQAHSA